MYTTPANMEEKILYLSLQSKWFEMIEKGIKKEEYREIKPFWVKRIGMLEAKTKEIEQIPQEELIFMMEKKMEQGYLNSYYTHVQFSFGYTKRTMLFEINDITIGIGRENWGAPIDKKVFIIHLGNKIN